MQRQQKTVALAAVTIQLHFLVQPNCQGYLVYTNLIELLNLDVTINFPSDSD
ncbi:hypothetical protein [Nostoc sp. ChiQUE01b]|uniref:hypothetical protein n=1 Tax=Nostoc sp. ChiQUE01b TaxID=3075376 RepID=UPI002AD54DD6|nr:hypothetical protein [Nostoc sp. ChiQUE01b]